MARRETQTVGCNYLDGIPVKISERFRPPRRVTLPLSYQQRCPTELLNTEYDFSLEKNVLELAETKRLGREAAERAKADKLAESIEEFTRLVSCSGITKIDGELEDWKDVPKCSDETENGQFTADCSKERSDNPHSYVVTDDQSMSGIKPGPDIPSLLLSTLEPNVLLKPVPSSAGTVVSDKPDVTITSTFNLEDFEAESSPFDSMALKTLNDLEELKSVLQNTNPASAEGMLRNSRHVSRNGSPDDRGNSEMINNNCLISDGAAESSMSNGCEKNVDAAAVCFSQQEVPGGINYRVINQNMLLSGIASSGSGNDQQRFTGPVPGGQFPPTGVFEGMTSIMTKSTDSAICCSLPVGSTVDFALNALPIKGSPNEVIYASVVPLRSSRSTPDLLKELGTTLAAEREKNKLIATVSEPKHPNSAGCTNGSLPEQPEETAQSNAILEAGTDCQTLIDHIADMGFPRDRVTRAIQKLGTDDKKVIEHLCLVQSLIEKGYNADDAEAALYLHQHKEAKAKAFLDLMIQFRDLGFEDEAIKRALLHTENNRDKALDFLVS